MLLPPIFAAAISSDESMAILTPSRAARIGTFETDKFKMSLRPAVAILVMVNKFARPAALVLVSRILSSDAFASVASNVDPS